MKAYFFSVKVECINQEKYVSGIITGHDNPNSAMEELRAEYEKRYGRNKYALIAFNNIS